MGLLILDHLFVLRHVTLVYLVPVVIAATKLGIYAGGHRGDSGRGISLLLLSADLQLSRAGPPTSDRAPALRLRRDCHRPSRDQSRRQADLARRRETDVHDLYAFSRRLAAAHTASDIYTAIREHLASIIGHRTILFETAPRGGVGATLSDEERVPDQVKRETEAVALGRKGRTKASSTTAKVTSGSFVPFPEKPVILAYWRSILGSRRARRLTPSGNGSMPFCATPRQRWSISISGRPSAGHASARNRGAARCPDRLGARLRTPLVWILGAATVISRAPGNRADPRLASLADILRDEVDRLNNDVQDCSTLP